LTIDVNQKPHLYFNIPEIPGTFNSQEWAPVVTVTDTLVREKSLLGLWSDGQNINVEILHILLGK
jgi:hypothetical protein